MADWQERVQSLIIGFVFGYMVVKLFSVISSFRAGNLRVARGSDVDDAVLVPSELGPGEELSAPLIGTDEETEADGGDELEDRAEGESSTSSDSEAEEDAAPASRPREIDTTTDEPTVSGVESKDVETTKDEEVEAKKDEEIEDVSKDVGKTESKDFVTPGDDSLKALSEEEAGVVGEEEFEDEDETDDWEGVESTELEKLFGAASTYADTMVALPGVNPSSEAMMQLHAFYKIATEGPCSSSQPSAFQPTARAKWNAWQKLGSMPQEEAMQKYIATLAEINPIWYEDYRKSKEPAKETVEQKDASGNMDALPVSSELSTSGIGGQADTEKPIHACAKEGDLENLGQLLDLGVSIDLKASDGRTPLILAADRGQLNAVKMLLAKGAEIHAKDLEGQTALHYATIHEHETVAKYLVEHGADVNAPDIDGTTPLKLCPQHWLWLQGSPP